MLRVPFVTLLATLLAAQTPIPANPPVPTAAQPSQPKEDVVLAKLGAKTIRQSDFDTFLRLVFSESQRNQMNTTPGALERMQAGYLDSLVLAAKARKDGCLLYTSPSPRDRTRSRMPSSA